MRHFLFPFLFPLTIVACGGNANNILPPEGPPGGQPAGQNTRTTFGIYVVGSDLEDDLLPGPSNGVPDEMELGGVSLFGAGSDDLREIIEGYGRLGPAEKGALQILVAFGGARKQGWTGVKFADIDCLIRDGADQYFGNDSCYASRDDGANMAASATLESFLAFFRMRSAAEPSRKMLVLWNHGAAYQGIGVDSTQPQQDRLELTELSEAFGRSGLRFDLIGMDACLMASLEVAQTVAPHGDFLVASEEVEPGHGWDYRQIVEFLGRSPGASSQDVGKKVVDSYLDGSSIFYTGMPTERSHTETKQKTLSVIDLKKVDAILMQLDGMLPVVAQAGEAVSYDTTLRAFSAAQHYGSERKNGTEFGVDLENWADEIKSAYPAGATAADALDQAVEAAVVYTRQDGTKPESNGLSIYTPLNTVAWEHGYMQSSYLSMAWRSFLTNFVSGGLNDVIKPRLISEVPTSTGVAVTFEDNKGIKGAVVVYAALGATAGVFDIWGMEKLAPNNPMMMATGPRATYDLGPWNGNWLVLCDGPCETGDRVFVPAYEEGASGGGGHIYAAEAILAGAGSVQGENVIVHVEIANGTFAGSWVTAFAQTATGEVILSKEQFALARGQTIRFVQLQINTNDNADGESYVLGANALTFTGDPTWGGEPLASDLSTLFFFVVASDLKGNAETSSVYHVGP